MVLFDDAGSVVQSMLAVDGTRIVATPAAPLAAGRTYQVIVNGVRDEVGNPVQWLMITFRT